MTRAAQQQQRRRIIKRCNECQRRYASASGSSTCCPSCRRRSLKYDGRSISIGGDGDGDVDDGGGGGGGAAPADASAAVPPSAATSSAAAADEVDARTTTTSSSSTGAAAKKATTTTTTTSASSTTMVVAAATSSSPVAEVAARAMSTPTTTTTTGAASAAGDESRGLATTAATAAGVEGTVAVNAGGAAVASTTGAAKEEEEEGTAVAVAQRSAPAATKGEEAPVQTAPVETAVEGQDDALANTKENAIGSGGGDRRVDPSTTTSASSASPEAARTNGVAGCHVLLDRDGSSGIDRDAYERGNGGNGDCECNDGDNGTDHETEGAIVRLGSSASTTTTPLRRTDDENDNNDDDDEKEEEEAAAMEEKADEHKDDNGSDDDVVADRSLTASPLSKRRRKSTVAATAAAAAPSPATAAGTAAVAVAVPKGDNQGETPPVPTVGSSLHAYGNDGVYGDYGDKEEREVRLLLRKTGRSSSSSSSNGSSSTPPPAWLPPTRSSEGSRSSLSPLCVPPRTSAAVTGNNRFKATACEVENVDVIDLYSSAEEEEKEVENEVATTDGNNHHDRKGERRKKPGGDEPVASSASKGQPPSKAYHSDPSSSSEVPDRTQAVTSKVKSDGKGAHSNAAAAAEGSNNVGPSSSSSSNNTRHSRNSNSRGKDDCCFICGSEFSRITTGVSGRVNHLKRCAKKYGVSMRGCAAHDDDDDEEEMGLASPPPPAAAAASATAKTNASAAVQRNDREWNNPYGDGRWHGDAEMELALTEQPESAAAIQINNQDEGTALGSSAAAAATTTSFSSSTKSTPQQPQQSTMKDFFKAPARSLNNVLLAGARRLAKGAEISSSRNNTNKKHQNYGGGKGGRGGGNGQFKRKRADYSKAPCPGYKRIPGTNFICDGFLYARSNLSKNYFLTHFHADHYGGITKRWNAGIIYCSLPTANLVHQQLGVDKKYLHPIGMMTPTIIESNGRAVTVTLLDANHCPGAIMFLFEVGNKKILHVGDFRWNRDVMMRQPPLRSFASLQCRLDEIFLDTTYCDEKYAFPTQDEAIDAAFEIAQAEAARARESSSKTLFLFGSYTIGKERIYLTIAERLGWKVYVDRRRYRILSALNWPDNRMQLFTTNKEEACIWVVPLGKVSFKFFADFLDEANSDKVFSQRYDRVVGFRPTGWTFAAAGNSIISSRTNGKFSVHGVPYSEHSSFPELVDCLLCLRPKKIIPTVSVSKSAEQCELLLQAVREKEEDQRSLIR